MRIITTLLFIVLCIPTVAQKTSKNRRQDGVQIVRDVYLGSINGTSGKIDTRLILEHAGKFVDDGKFVLIEVSSLGEKRSKGDWTVLRGDAKDRNATVVELYNPQRSIYFLRRKDGLLQKLDSQLRELKPVGNFLLRKVGQQ